MQKEPNDKTTCNKQVHSSNKHVQESKEKDDSERDEVNTTSTKVIRTPTEEGSTEYEAEVLNGNCNVDKICF